MIWKVWLLLSLLLQLGDALLLSLLWLLLWLLSVYFLLRLLKILQSKHFTFCPLDIKAVFGARSQQAAAEAEQAVAAAEQKEKEAAAAAQAAASASFAAEARAEELTGVVKQLQVIKQLLAYVLNMHRTCAKTICVCRLCVETISLCNACPNQHEIAACMHACMLCIAIIHNQ